MEYGRIQAERENPTFAKALAEARSIVREIFGQQKITVYLFGSWVCGKASSCSDIDLAVESPAPLPRGALARLRERLEESHIPYRVEVVDLGGADPVFRERVHQEGIAWSD